MKKLSILIAACALTACATWGQNLNEALDAMVNQPLSVAIAKLGNPSEDQNLGSEHVVKWNLVNPGARPCSITLEVDSFNVIKKYDYEGNADGCERYIKALKKH